MRRFLLCRSEDLSGSSGEGRVAEGVHFSDDSAVMRWFPGLVNACSTSFFPNIADVERIHGHGGRTKIEYIDETSDALMERESGLLRAYAVSASKSLISAAL